MPVNIERNRKQRKTRKKRTKYAIFWGNPVIGGNARANAGAWKETVVAAFCVSLSQGLGWGVRAIWWELIVEVVEALVGM